LAVATTEGEAIWRAVAESLAEMEADKAVAESGWPAEDDDDDAAKKEAEMEAEMKKAAFLVKVRWQIKMASKARDEGGGGGSGGGGSGGGGSGGGGSAAVLVKKEPIEKHVAAPIVKKEPTEQHVGAPIVKKGATEQHVGGGGGGFSSIRDFPRHRVLRGVAAPISTNQLQGLHDAINPTGDGDGDGAPASSFSERLDDHGVLPLAPWEMHASDM
jgi:hypothetical protein